MLKYVNLSCAHLFHFVLDFNFHGRLFFGCRVKGAAAAVSTAEHESDVAHHEMAK